MFQVTTDINYLFQYMSLVYIHYPILLKKMSTIFVAFHIPCPPLIVGSDGNATCSAPRRLSSVPANVVASSQVRLKPFPFLGYFCIHLMCHPWDNYSCYF